MFPVFAVATEPSSATDVLTHRRAGELLGVHPKHVGKMVRAGMLPRDDGGLVGAAAVRNLIGRPALGVVAGELTVLRTDARESSRERYPDDDREWLGFHVDQTDAELEAASLRWWRSSPPRVVDNRLFVVTVATFPVALYLIEDGGHVDSIRLPGERFDRQHYTGTLLARVGPGMTPWVSPDLPEWLDAPARQVMGSTITVEAGGPIGYLEPM